jgi:hypothetical protein
VRPSVVKGDGGLHRAERLPATTVDDPVALQLAAVRRPSRGQPLVPGSQLIERQRAAAGEGLHLVVTEDIDQHVSVLHGPRREYQLPGDEALDTQHGLIVAGPDDTVAPSCAGGCP